MEAWVFGDDFAEDDDGEFGEAEVDGEGELGEVDGEGEGVVSTMTVVRGEDEGEMTTVLVIGVAEGVVDVVVGGAAL